MMKNLQIILLLLISLPVFSQWVQLSYTPTEILNDVYCINEDIVVAVGNNGYIIKTIDGGATWQQKSSGVIKNLTKVQFVNTLIGYATGSRYSSSNQILLRTTDGGNSWSSVILNTIQKINDISIIAPNILYVSGETSTSFELLKSIDFGQSFNVVNDSQYISQLQFLTEFDGYASNGGELLKTNDVGVSWQNIGTVDYNTQSNLSSFNFYNPTTGFVKKSNTIYQTTDGGLNYTQLNSINYYMPKIVASSDKVIWGMTLDLLLNGQPNFTYRGEINNGVIQNNEVMNPLFRSMAFANGSIGYGVAGNIYKNVTGLMLTTTDTSKKIFTIFPNPSNDILTIIMDDNLNKIFKVEINDFLGKNLFAELFNFEKEIKINTRIFAKGTYFLTVENDNKKQVQKLIIN